MKRNRRDTAAKAAAAALALVVLAGCSIGPVNLDSLVGQTSVAEARAQRRERLVPVVADSDLSEAGALTVGVKSSEAAPLVLRSTTDGSLAGIDVDTAYALADALGLSSVTFVSVPSASAGLASGCDVVMGVDANEDAAVTVVGDYAQSALGVFGGSSASASVDASDLAGATVAVQSGSVSQAALSKLDLSVDESTYTNLNEAFDALSAGSADYVVCDAYAGAYLACTHDGISFVGTLDDPSSVGVALSPDASSLTAAVRIALEQVQENGVAAIAKARWVGDLPTLTDATKVTGVSAALATAVDATAATATAGQ